MFMGYGIAIAIIIEWWRRRKDRFKDPTASWMTDFVRDELLPVDERNLSHEAKYERFLKRCNRKWRDDFGSDSIYRTTTISNLIELYISQKRYFEARGWQNLNILILEFNQVADEKLASAYAKMAELELRMGRIQEASLSYGKAADVFRKLSNLEGLSQTLGLHFEALGNRDLTKEALAVSDELLEVMATLHGPDAVEIETHLARAELVLDRERIPASRKKLLRLLSSLHVSEAALGKDHYAVARELRHLSAHFAATGKVSAAADLAERARMISLLNNVSGTAYPGIERDLIAVAEWLEKRNKEADRTVAFHMRKRAERIEEKKLLKGKR